MSRRKPWAESTLQKLPLEVLSIEALNKVLDMRAEYDKALQKYQAWRTQIVPEEAARRAAESAAKQERNDVVSQIAQVVKQLAPFEASIIGTWLFSSPTLQAGARSYRLEAQPLVTRWHMLCKRRNELNELIDHPQPLSQKHQNLESNRQYEPTKKAKLRYRSQTFDFDISAIDPDRILRIIEKQLNKVDLELEQEKNKRQRAQIKLGRTTAKAAAYENKQRELAKSIRTALRKELKDNPYCPYCNKELSTKDAHADHIHPVVNGGLSTIGNMVFVCGSCNVAKGTLTLRAFLKKIDFVEADVYERLELMRKDV